MLQSVTETASAIELEFKENAMLELFLAELTGHRGLWDPSGADGDPPPVRWHGRTVLKMNGLRLSGQRVGGRMHELRLVVSNDAEFSPFRRGKELRIWAPGGRFVFELSPVNAVAVELAIGATQPPSYSDGVLPLFIAVLQQHAGRHADYFVQEQIDTGTPVNSIEWGDELTVGATPRHTITALIMACFHGNGNVVDLLLELNADVNQCCSDGWSPIMQAVFQHESRGSCSRASFSQYNDIVATLVLSGASTAVPGDCLQAVAWIVGGEASQALEPSIVQLAQMLQDTPMLELTFLACNNWKFDKSQFTSYREPFRAEIRSLVWCISTLGLNPVFRQFPRQF